MDLKITAASSALFSTWVFVENFGLLFDAGDGVSASLGQKGRKIRHIFITHADRDHVCGLLQLHQLNANQGLPHIYYPRDCGSFPALRDFVKQFDPQSGPATWKGLGANETVELENDHFILARASAHVMAEGRTKALDYTFCSVRKVLRPEFRSLSGPEIALKRKELGDDAIAERKIEKLIGYSGDAPELNSEHWSGVKVLIHEATFLERETGRGAHSCLAQVISAAARMDLEALILIHFSARYSASEIESSIRKQADQFMPCFPIYAVLPGLVASDILKTEPVWRPT